MRLTHGPRAVPECGVYGVGAAVVVHRPAVRRCPLPACGWGRVMADDNVTVDIPISHLVGFPRKGTVTVLLPRDLVMTLAAELEAQRR